jgi:mannose-6-phosphate isomerase-like protein (cupin superfamily)
MNLRSIWRLLLAGVAATAVAGTASSASPQAPTMGVEDAIAGVKTKAELEQLDVLLRAGAVPPEISRELFAREGAAYSIDTSYFANRVQTPQLHLTYDEIFVVLSGAAKLTLGGELVNGKPHNNDPVEIRSPEMKGGNKRTIATGDVISVPRGTVHFVNPGVGHIHYMVIKVMGNKK